MEYSQYQQNIFDWIKNGTGHAVVMARAGSGKTFTIEHALKFIDWDEDVLFLAFNKHIADELKRKIRAPNVEIMTLNSFGWRICRDNTNVKMDIRKNQNAIKKTIPEYALRLKVQGAISRLIGLRKATGEYDIDALAAKFDVELPKEFDYAEFETIWETVIANTARMDFDDQIFMPIHYSWPIPKFDWVFVDEAQDLSPTQITLVSKAGARIVAVGDDRQAIYGFRGADPEAINNIVEVLRPTILPLNVSYRCPSAILDEARKIVPDIENAPGCQVGEVRHAKLDAQEGDYVLCRTTAPLVGECLKMISNGRKAMVKGREIGQNLIKLMKKVGIDQTIFEFVQGLEVYHQQESDRLRAKGRDTTSIDDKVMCIDVLLEGSDSVQDVISKINDIFQNSEIGVVFCTVHRAKGLEAKHIWILRPDLMPFPKAKLSWQRKQEMNLKYVAITRAQETLTYVV